MIAFALFAFAAFAALLLLFRRRKASGRELALFVVMYAFGFVIWVSVLLDKPLSPLKLIEAAMKGIGLP